MKASTKNATLETFCPLDCPDACSLSVQVEDGRLTKLDGDRRNPVTQGFICNKVRQAHRHVYCPERMLYPGIREGRKGAGRFRRASWDEALDRVAKEIGRVRNAVGGEGILPHAYGGSNGLLTQGTTDARLFHRLGASRLDQTVCAATAGRASEGLYGRVPGVAHADFVRSRLIVIWGANPSVSSIHLVPFIKKAQARGAKLVVVDPRRIPLAKQADLHLQLRPGSDLPLALAVLRWLFTEERADLDFLARHADGVDELRRRTEPWTLERAAEATGVAAAELEAFARLYADSSPAVVRCGWGVERCAHGGSATAAILALPAVGGKLGVRGGGFTLSNSGAWSFDLSAQVGAPEPDTRVINMNRLGRALTDDLDPPIQLLFVYNSNPLATSPNRQRIQQGLEREDLFTVVFDPILTDTARYADVVLPATTFFEHAELQRGYGSLILQRSEPVIEPVAEARNNHEVFLELCRRTGVARGEDVEDLEAFAAAAVASTGHGGEILRQLGEDRTAALPGSEPPVLCDDIPPATADGKIHLCPADLDAEAPGGLYRFTPQPAADAPPLVLISPATNKTISSTFGQLQKGITALELHPDDAEARGIESGDPVRIFNDLGEVHCDARLNDDLQPGTAFLPKGIWSHNTHNGVTGNALVPDSLSDLAGGARFNDARVEVAKLQR